MASFTFDFSVEEIIPQALQDENLGKSMVKSGLGVMQKAITSSAQRHVKTGALASSIKSTKLGMTSNGAIIGRIYFKGKDKRKVPNALKAIVLEYGSKKQRATPFVRGAVQSSNSRISNAMKEVFDNAAK